MRPLALLSLLLLAGCAWDHEPPFARVPYEPLSRNSVVQIDPGRCLGLTGCREVIRMVEAAGLRYSAHSWSSAVNTAASVHALAISASADVIDFKPHESPVQGELVDDPWRQTDGVLPLRPLPGLGISVRDETVERLALT